MTNNEETVEHEISQINEAYMAYVQAHAAYVCAPEASQEEENEQSAQLQEALRKFMTIPTRLPWAILEKFNIYEREFLHPDHGVGREAACLFAALKEDALALASWNDNE